MVEPVSFSDIRAARDRIAGTARVTPLLEAEGLNEMAGRRVLVKAECLQRTGSFKFRGAWNALTAMAPEQRARGVLAYSSGNHAQGVALAARLHGVPATIVMPTDAPAAKIANTRAHGAEVVLYDRWSESREAIGEELAAREGLSLVRPFDEPMVIAGQGTCGLEIAEQAREAGVEEAEVIVCTGGGGLLAGIALALEGAAPGLKPRPAEPVGFDDTARSFIAGERLRVDHEARSICDAIISPMPGEITFPITSARCLPGLVASDDEARRAMAAAFRHLRVVAEPGGAIALAAVLFRGDEIKGDTVICTISGGNVDPALFSETIAEFA